MRRMFYSLSLIVGGLCLALLAIPSFGSDRITQEEPQEHIRTAAPNPLSTVPFSPESTVPYDVRVYILSFLCEQKDLLHIGGVSKSWRKAAAKVWENKMLDLSEKPLTKADYQALARGIFPRLGLNNVGPDENELNILATCSHLQSLELQFNNLCATKSLIKLVSLMGLSDINLGYNIIRDAGAAALADAFKQNTSLTMVYLNGSSIGVEGARAIAEALKQNKSLTTVDLGSNRIGDAGAKAMADALKYNQTLTTVNLHWNKIGNEGAAAIAEALSQNRTLTMVNLIGNIIGNEGVKAIAESIALNTTLAAVNLCHSSIGDKVTKVLEDLKRSRPSLELYY